VILVSCKTGQHAISQKPAERATGQSNPQLDTRYQEAFFKAVDYRDRGDWQKAEARFEECLSISATRSAAPHYELSRIIRVDRNDPSTALRFAKAAVAIDPNNPWYRHELGDVYLAMGKYDLAVKEYQVVEKLNPDDPNNLYEQAGAYLFAGKLKEAIAVYDRLERKSGVYEELSLEKHHLYLELNMPKEAGEELEKLARSIPEEPRLWGMALRYYAASGMKDREKFALQQLLNSDPSDGLVRFQLSEYYAFLGEDKRSFEELRLAFATTDVGIDKKIGVLLRYYTLSEYDRSFLPDAYELLELTELAHPGEAKALAMFGDFLYRDGRDAEALAKYDKAVELDPGRSQLWTQLLSLEAALKRYDKLIIDAARALELFPNMPEYYLYHGIALEKMGRSPEALTEYLVGKELVIDDNALSTRFLSALAAFYHTSKRFKEADDALNQALKLDPDNPFILNNYAYYLAERKTRLNDAEEMARKCISVSPSEPSFLDTYAWVLFQSGRVEDALIWIEKAWQAGGQDMPEILEHYGDILHGNSRKAEARQRWQEAMNHGGPTERLQLKLNDR